VEGKAMRRVLSLAGDLLGSLLILGAGVFGAAVLVQSRSLVYLLFALPSLVAAAAGAWRGRASALRPWLLLAVLNLPTLAAAVWLGAAEGAWPLLALSAVSAVFSTLGLWLVAGEGSMVPSAPSGPSGHRWQAALALLLVGNLGLALAIPRFVSSLIVHRELREPAPAFQLALLDGGTVSSQELRGRVVVLDFWTTWCQPCRREFPELERVYERFRDRPEVAFYAVDADRGDTPDNARRFFRETGYHLPVAYDHGSKTYAAFTAPGLPTLVVIDRAGRLRFRHSGFLGAEDFAGNLSRLLELLLREG
jgi:cytochrome c biogenesis protein CcmG/thiol:disulfide interchange protein DsbE